MSLNNVKINFKNAKKTINRLLKWDIITLKAENSAKKNVLLSYITLPFRIGADNPAFYTHTNTWECLQIAKTWLNHGFNVDIIDWDNHSFVPKKDYDVFIDIHSNMERIAPLLKKNCLKILHITGSHWSFQNNAEMKRLSELKIRKGVQLKPRRQVPPSLGIEYADCATILGNKFTQSTFAYSGKPLYQIPLSTTVQFPFFVKDFNKIRKNYLWLGSSGMVHKGLDLVLDAFSQMPDYHLFICGPVDQEKDFHDLYYKELYQSQNIETMGFIDIRSDKFLNIIKNTCALIYPSCSEGQAGSVITCLHAGLIPVISEQSGVDIDGFGILLNNNSIEEIISSIKYLSNKPKEELESMSRNAWDYARIHHTRENFAKCYNTFVDDILSNQ
ncbi:MAG: glycosyltransferase [Methanolinea sp.]|nr:glycosyltransferase [Methanolinea sp.]